MEELNREIGKLNNEWYYKNRDLYKNLTDDCVAPEPKYVKFHTYGLRMKGAMKHGWEWWRQTKERSHMLRLAYEQRIKMGRAVGNFFIHQFEKYHE